MRPVIVLNGWHRPGTERNVLLDRDESPDDRLVVALRSVLAGDQGFYLDHKLAAAYRHQHIFAGEAASCVASACPSPLLRCQVYKCCGWLALAEDLAEVAVEGTSLN